MRIDGIAVKNFKGIECADIAGLSNSPVVTLSGRNGVGKSLILEAIYVATNRHLSQSKKLVGPWGDETSIDISIAFTPEEWDIVVAHGEQRGHTLPEGESKCLHFGTTFDRVGNAKWTGTSHWADLVRDQAFRAQHPFARVDFYPAERTYPRGEEASINLRQLSEGEARKFQQQVSNTMGTVARPFVQMTDVKTFLASLDYQELVAMRDGETSPHGYDLLVTAFKAGTGKTILRPTTHDTEGIEILAETSIGVRHDVAALSSGEQEVLSIMHFIHRSRVGGGVLLLDEPELHLHPSLQEALFKLVQSKTTSAQIWLSTHSPKLVTVAPLNAVLHATAATGDSTNQLQRASDIRARDVLLDDLGLRAVDLLLNDMIVIVEGPSDAKYLQMLYPDYLRRALIHEAGSVTSVTKASEILAKSNPSLPWICIRDRDLLLNPEEIIELERQTPDLFIWRRRMLENCFLDPELISAALSRLGKTEDAGKVWRDLSTIADTHKEEVLQVLVQSELSRRSPRPKSTQRASIEEKISRQLSESISEKQFKLAALPDVLENMRCKLDARWHADWPILVDGKRVLGDYTKQTGLRSRDGFIGLLATTYAEQGLSVNSSFTELRSRLRSLANQNIP